MTGKNSKVKSQKSNSKLKSRRTFAFLLAILTFAFLLLTLKLAPQAQAFTMSNGNWIIHMGDFNSMAGQSTGRNNKITSSLGQVAAGLYGGKNYKVKGGFAYIQPTSSFSFSVSDTLINFGLLTATNPVVRTSTFTISNPGTSGYQVVGYEDRPLINESNIPIPNTTCDNGSCSETTSALWTSSLTYGFGYRCDTIINISCSKTFSEPDYYRKFANLQKDESPQTIIIGKKSGRNRKAKITYKVNISGTQMAGIYSNSIIYIAAPTY
jgi:hypothetical protein